MASHAATSETLAAGPHRGLSWRKIVNLGGLLEDPAVRYGIKFGVAGVLAVFIAEYYRLQNPTWALFTVFVLMIAQYVGAIAEKSFFRMIGTAAGGLIGYLLTATLEQNPVAYLLLIGVVVGFSTAMFGQNRYPYAFLLCGLTTVVVTSNGFADPDNSWQYMLARIQEVGVGIVVTLVVQSLLWPRYARVEFGENSRAAFADLKECFHDGAGQMLGESQTDGRQVAQTFPARITALRGLLDFGARESLYFRLRLPTYFKITTCLSRIASSISTLCDTLPEASIYRIALRQELQEMHASIEDALDDLSNEEATPDSRRVLRERMDKAFEGLATKMENMRHDPKVFEVPIEEATSVGMHGLALEDMREQIRHAHELLDSLPQDPAVYSKEIEPFVSPWPPPFWIRAGIKSGIAVIIALILDNWLNPPGGTMMVLGAWVFTATNASSPGGSGDRRTFHFLVYNTLIMIAGSLIVLLTSPALSSYAVMNIVMFAWLFIWGYLSFTTKGMTIPMQMGMLGLVNVLALNGQEPVSFQSVVGFFFGIVLAQIIASVIQRTIWPSLPQWELRTRFLELLHLSQRIVEDGPDSLPFWQRARLALIPGEAGQRIAVLEPPNCPEGEQANLTEYLQALRRVGNHLVVTIGKLPSLLPLEHLERGRELIAQFEAVIMEQLRGHEKDVSAAIAIRSNNEKLTAMLATWELWVREVRTYMISHQYPVPTSLRILGFAGRYRRVSTDLIEAGASGAKLRLPLYMGDYVL